MRLLLCLFALTACSDNSSDEKDGDVNNETNNETAAEESIVDSDSDGLSDEEEAELGTDPNDADTDDDGLSDGEEAEGESDPLQADADDDGLNDSEEAAANTDPNNADTDGDGAEDGIELEQATDPTDANSFPIKPEEGDWLLSNTNVLLDGCNLESLLSTFGSDLFAILPEDYRIVNSTYENFEIEISTGNASCPIGSSGFVCETLSINESIDDVGVVISVDLNLEGTLSSATSMEATLSATLTNCEGNACGLLTLANVNIPCDVSIRGQGNR
ncbi:MAG: hypothetical protein VX278_23665 [Myxococcota bacterium]|nr:hypothetical protein [Myxococcota bacterium]